MTRIYRRGTPEQFERPEEVSGWSYREVGVYWDDPDWVACLVPQDRRLASVKDMVAAQGIGEEMVERFAVHLRKELSELLGVLPDWVEKWLEFCSDTRGYISPDKAWS